MQLLCLMGLLNTIHLSQPLGPTASNVTLPRARSFSKNEDSNPHSEDSKFLPWVPRAISNTNLWSANIGRSWRQHHYNLPWSKYAKIIIWNSILTASQAWLPAHQQSGRAQHGSKSARVLSDLRQAVACAHGVWEEDRLLRDASSLIWLGCQPQSSTLNMQLLCQHTPRHRHTMGWTVSVKDTETFCHLAGVLRDGQASNYFGPTQGQQMVYSIPEVSCRTHVSPAKPFISKGLIWKPIH